MKEFAKSLVHARVPVRRDSMPSQQPAAESVRPTPVPKHSVYNQHDSWATRNRHGAFTPEPPPPAVEPIVPAEPAAEAVAPQEAAPSTPLPRKAAYRRHIKPEKVRATSISVSVSQQEYEAILYHCDQNNITMSEFIRRIAFRAMGMPIPSRKPARLSAKAK